MSTDDFFKNWCAKNTNGTTLLMPDYVVRCLDDFLAHKIEEAEKANPYELPTETELREMTPEEITTIASGRMGYKLALNKLKEL